MTELQFKKLLIDTIKLDDNPNFDEICESLKLTTFRFRFCRIVFLAKIDYTYSCTVKTTKGE